MNLKLEMVTEERMEHTKKGLCEDLKNIVKILLDKNNLKRENIISISISYPGFVGGKLLTKRVLILIFLKFRKFKKRIRH